MLLIFNNIILSRSGWNYWEYKIGENKNLILNILIIKKILINYNYNYIWIAVKISVNYFSEGGSNYIEIYTKLYKIINPPKKK